MAKSLAALLPLAAHAWSIVLTGPRGQMSDGRVTRMLNRNSVPAVLPFSSGLYRCELSFGRNRHSEERPQPSSTGTDAGFAAVRQPTAVLALLTIDSAVPLKIRAFSAAEKSIPSIEVTAFSIDPRRCG
jgi:hypothetical protein